MNEWNPRDTVQNAGNAYKPTYEPTETTGGSWRGGNFPYTYDMYKGNTGGNSSFGNTLNTAKNVGLLGTGAAVAGGILTGGTGFLVAGLIEVAGGILGGIFGKPEKSPEQKYFEHLCNFYHDLGKKSQVSRNILSMMTGKPADSYIGSVGYKDASDAYKRLATFVPASSTPVKSKKVE